MISIISMIGMCIVVYFFLLSAWYLISIIVSFPKIIKIYQQVELGNISELILKDFKTIIPLSIIIPTYNGEKRVLNTIYSILESTYKNVQIIVGNDGSTDNTMELLKNKFELYEIPPVFKKIISTSPIRHFYQSKLYPNLFVLDKEHNAANNAADINNAGLNAARSPLCITLDDDTVLEPNALSLLFFSFLSQPNTLAVGGALRILDGNKVEKGKLLTRNMPTEYLPALQSLEFLRSFTYGRASMDVSVGGAMGYSGAYSLFETQALRDVGGFDTHNPSYDAEVIMKIQQTMRKNKYPTNIHYMAGSFAWTDEPSTLRKYCSQRMRWQYGLLMSCFKHIGMLFNPKYGVAGMIFFPAYLFFETFGPIVECISYILLVVTVILGIISWPIVVWFFLLAWGYIVLISVLSYMLDLYSFHSYKNTSIFRIISTVTLEMLGLRQMRAISCTCGAIKYLFKSVF